MNSVTVDEHRFTDSDLYKIVLGATLGINPFHKLSAGEIRRLCIENHERLEQVRDLFSVGSSDEASEVLGKLREQINHADKPWCWMLDHDPQAVVRAFTLSAIMHQHGIEYDVLLDNFETGLGRYQKIPKKVIDQTIKDMLQADPDQMAEDVGLVESFLKEEPEKRLAFLVADRCKIDEPAQARNVLLAEKLSGLVRSLALLSLLIDLLTSRNTTFHKQILDALDEEGTKGKADALPIAARRPTPQWSTLLATYRRAMQFFQIASKLKAEVLKLKVLKPDQLEFSQFDQLWNEAQGESTRLLHERSETLDPGRGHPADPQGPVLDNPHPAVGGGPEEAQREHHRSRAGRGCGECTVPGSLRRPLREVDQPPRRPGDLHAPVHPEGLEDALGR